MTLTAETAFAALEATWPAASTAPIGPWWVRTGLGGGKRVSAASQRRVDDTPTDSPPPPRFEQLCPNDLSQAEAAMQGLGQAPLFMLRPDEPKLDQMLADAGYHIVDETVIYAIRVAELAAPLAPLAVIAAWPPLAITKALWKDAGIGPDRLNVMARAMGPKTTLMSRIGNAPAGGCFLAVADKVAMLHALEMRPDLRRQAGGRNLCIGAANWAAEAGAHWLALAVTTANIPARRLYESLGMQVVARYHYRMWGG
jgi:GNAT superfamily N-acetyltransferase